MITLGRRIASARIQSGLSIRALGRLLGKSEGAIRNYEKDRSQPPLETLREISKITEKPMVYFYGEEIEPEQTQVKIGDATITADAETIERMIATLKKTEPASEDTGPDPGVLEFFADTELYTQLKVTQEERAALAGLRGGNIKRKEQALSVLMIFRS